MKHAVTRNLHTLDVLVHYVGLSNVLVQQPPEAVRWNAGLGGN